MGFQTLKVKNMQQKFTIISKQSALDFLVILIISEIKKKLEEAMTVVDSFGKDARSITRTLENIKDPEQIEKAISTENVEKFSEIPKQAKN